MDRISTLLHLLIGGLLLTLPGCDSSELMPWHREKLTLEFTADQLENIPTLAAYRKLEERLFEQMEQEVYKRVPSGKGYELVRYSKGSSADPHQRTPDWNRCFEFTAETPVGGVLLLHGMSDSPYSLKALGQRLNKEGYWVVGLRLPGHGTVPSGLLTTTWEDMAAAVKLAAQHLHKKVNKKALYIVGYSTGASLALNFTLDTLVAKTPPVPAGLVLISPAIGIHPAASLAGVKHALSSLPGLGHLAWLSIKPEFDPYKYNSFATNAGNQVHRITRSVSRRIKSISTTRQVQQFPPVLVFKSAIDATVSTRAVLDNLLIPLNNKKHELVVFDINRHGAISPLLVNDLDLLAENLMKDTSLSFPVTFLTNTSKDSLQVSIHYKQPFSPVAETVQELPYTWPSGVISLSHVALPFPPDDPLYGVQPPKKGREIYLGQMNIKGERGLLKIPYDWLLRLRHNPFYGYLEQRTLQWMAHAGDDETVQ